MTLHTVETWGSTSYLQMSFSLAFCLCPAFSRVTLSKYTKFSWGHSDTQTWECRKCIWASFRCLTDNCAIQTTGNSCMVSLSQTHSFKKNSQAQHLFPIHSDYLRGWASKNYSWAHFCTLYQVKEEQKAFVPRKKKMQITYHLCMHT